MSYQIGHCFLKNITRTNINIKKYKIFPSKIVMGQTMPVITPPTLLSLRGA